MNRQLQVNESYRRKLAKLTGQQLSELVDTVSSYGDGEVKVRSEYKLTVDELKEFMLDHGYEKCPGCGWYVESSELLDDESEPKSCSNCGGPND